MDIYLLEKIIVNPARITSDTTSLIENGFITNSQLKVKSSCEIHLGINDHYMINACIKDAISKPPPKIIETIDLLEIMTKLRLKGI